MPRVHKKDEDKSIAGLAIPACLFIGMGLGFILENLAGWLFIGLGAGFVSMAILKMLEK